MKQPKSSPKLAREVSRWQIVGLSINDVIGSGVFLLPAAAAILLGGASIWAVFLAGCAVAILVLCFAEASSYFDEPGGAYLYTREAFGEFIGFEVGWMTWLARVTSVASLSVGFALACSYVWPQAAEGWGRVLVITSSLAFLTWINIIGVKQGAKMAVFLTIAKSVPLVAFIAIGIFAVEWELITSDIPAITFESLSEAVLLLLFAYVGFENTPAAAGEYKNPKKDVPFALLIMVLLVTVIYTLVQFVAVGTYPALQSSESPLADSGAYFAGAGMALLMTIGAMVSIFGNVGNTTLIGPRYLYALAKDGYGFKALAKIHPRYRTPAVAILVQSGIALALALSGSFVGLAMLSIIARLATYAGTAAALPILRKRFPNNPNAVRLPGGYTIPVIALIICLIFLISTTVENLIAGAVALLLGAVIFYFRSRDQPTDPE
ncbi:amino acid/polyamine/organocation transporter (APC superfamily) [Salegentibacter sp. 24]|uniref:APC family permease n=1 Tax=Salegentibacter sp. 24 TaxID=2183986 RepID=UPI001060A559|nr:APC family permease [Salegentibacter sp. 24]TDN89228.1 amino acid/polyamine/organocation transporter (APC superfamily) [Salegentibacter sp. 24]